MTRYRLRPLALRLWNLWCGSKERRSVRQWLGIYRICEILFSILIWCASKLLKANSSLRRAELLVQQHSNTNLNFLRYVPHYLLGGVDRHADKGILMVVSYKLMIAPNDWFKIKSHLQSKVQGMKCMHHICGSVHRKGNSGCMIDDRRQIADGELFRVCKRQTGSGTGRW